MGKQSLLNEKNNSLLGKSQLQAQTEGTSYVLKKPISPKKSLEMQETRLRTPIFIEAHYHVVYTFIHQEDQEKRCTGMHTGQALEVSKLILCYCHHVVYTFIHQ